MRVALSLIAGVALVVTNAGGRPVRASETPIFPPVRALQVPAGIAGTPYGVGQHSRRR